MIKNLKFIKYLFLSLLTVGQIQSSLAEYRIYQYWIKSPDREKGELITSSLDPRAYIAYYGKGPGTTISLMRSWICYGDTSGHQSPCVFEFVENTTNTENDPNIKPLK